MVTFVLMNVLKTLFSFYINASIHVALSVYSLVRITEIYFGFSYEEELNYFIFFGTITGYNFIKYAGVAKFYHRSLTTNLKIIQIFSLISFLALCYYAWKLPPETLILFIPLVLITVLYSVPFLAGFQKSLRGISYLKIFLVAFVWAGVTSSIPLIKNGYRLNVNMAIIFLQRFLFVVVLTLPFEIRDMQLDFENVKTLPQKIGVQLTKKVGFAMLLFALVFEFIITQDLITRNVFLTVCFALLILLMRSKENQSKFYSSFWVESLPILWWVLLVSFG